MPLASFEKQFPLLIESLRRAKASSQMPHSYIVYGDTPEMRSDFAIALAQLAACPESDSLGNACCKCGVCKQLENKCYPDLFILAPNSKSRKIRIGDDENDPDTMREFQSFFYLSSTTAGGKKIGIILDADRIQTEAQNAFLKTLEEPPGNSLFILCTAKPASLLPTVRSRCQMLPLLTNRCVYDFPGSESVSAILYRLVSEKSGSLLSAGECSSELIHFAGALHRQAEETVEKKWEKILGNMENYDPPSRKRCENRFQAEIEAEYLKRRSYFLSMIHCWFAQIYFLTCGIPPEEFPNRELFANIDIDKTALDENKAFSNLKKVEFFLQNLNWSVKEDLAISEFCHAVMS